MCFRPPSVEADKTCPACGATNSADAAVCEQCGEALPEAAVPAVPGVPTAPGVPKAPGAPAAPGAPKAPGAPGPKVPPAPGK